MPRSLLPQFVQRLESLENKMEIHLNESGEIRSDIKWLKWFVMGITGGWGAILIGIALWLVQK